MITNCESFRQCPGVGELYSLEELSFMGCEELEELPCLGKLTNFFVINIRGCKSIHAVPGLNDLVDLRYFDARECSKLAVLPDLGKLTELRELLIGPAVREVPRMDGLCSLTKFHASFGKLLEGYQQLVLTETKLSAVDSTDSDIRGGNESSMWTSVRSLLMLESLRLCGCGGEDVVPDLQNLERLKSVILFDCNIKDLSGLSNVTELEALVLDGCARLERLPEFERLAMLPDLRIRGCDDPRGWPCSRDLCSLQWMSLDGFSWMKLMPEIEKLKSLRELELWGRGCENALSMTSLSQLQRLYIKEFLTSEALDFSNFPQLKELWVDHCSALQMVTCILPLTALIELTVVHCVRLVEMPDLSMFPQLEELKMFACHAVKSLACSKLLTHVKEIDLCHCNQVGATLDLSKFPRLKVFFQEKVIFFGNRRMEYSADHP